MEEKTSPLGVFPLIPTEDLWTNQDPSGIEARALYADKITSMVRSFK